MHATLKKKKLNSCGRSNIYACPSIIIYGFAGEEDGLRMLNFVHSYNIC